MSESMNPESGDPTVQANSVDQPNQQAPHAEEIEPNPTAGAATDSTAQTNGNAARDAEAQANPKSELDLVKEQRDKYLELARRVQADFDNYQKRAVRDRETDLKYATQSIVSDLLPVIDNLEEAIKRAEGTSDVPSLMKGVELVKKLLVDTLERRGVTPIAPEGEPFDPNQHEAMMQQPSNDHPPMTVMMTIVKGYKLYDRLVRPAKVIVATAPTPAAASEN